MAITHLRSISVAALTVAVLGLAACSGSSGDDPTPDDGSYNPSTATSTSDEDMDALVAAAQEEGSLTLYTDGILEQQQAWADQFTEEYGIEVQIVRDSGGPLYSKFSQEVANGQGQADVFGNVDSQSLNEAVENDWLTEYTPQGGPDFPDERSRPGYYYPYLMGFAHSMIYNPNNVTPEEVAELQADPLKAAQDPKFKGRIGICPPQLALLATAFWYQYTDGSAGEEIGWDGLEKIAENAQLISDTLTLTNNVIQGEVDIAFPVADSIVGGFLGRDANTPLAFVYPNPTVNSQFGMGVVSDSPHPAAGRLFVEWASTLEGSNAVAALSSNQNLHADGDDDRPYLDTSWYQPYTADEVWNSSAYTTDEEFLDAVGPDGDWMAHWSQVFGYSG